MKNEMKARRVIGKLTKPRTKVHSSPPPHLSPFLPRPCGAPLQWWMTLTAPGRLCLPSNQPCPPPNIPPLPCPGTGGLWWTWQPWMGWGWLDWGTWPAQPGLKQFQPSWSYPYCFSTNKTLRTQSIGNRSTMSIGQTMGRTQSRFFHSSSYYVAILL